MLGKMTWQVCWVQAVAAQVKAAKREAKAAASLILQQELKARRRVLRRLGWVVTLLLAQLATAVTGLLRLCPGSTLSFGGFAGFAQCLCATQDQTCLTRHFGLLAAPPLQSWAGRLGRPGA